MNTETKKTIISLLMSTGRDGIAKLINWLDVNGFFISPASTKFHGSYAGGLADHSLGVFNLLLSGYVSTTNLAAVDRPGQKPYQITDANIIIAALLHDICKVGAYLGTEAPYKWNKEHAKGHAILSIDIIKGFIDLDPIEEMIIRYHMGIYGLKEYYEPGSWDYKTNAEYNLKADHSNDKPNMSKEEKEADKAARFGKTLRNAWFHQPICKLMYFCDEIETMQAKATE